MARRRRTTTTEDATCSRESLPSKPTTTTTITTTINRDMSWVGRGIRIRGWTAAAADDRSPGKRTVVLDGSGPYFFFRPYGQLRFFCLKQKTNLSQGQAWPLKTGYCT